MRSLTSVLLLSIAIVSALLGCAIPLCALGAAAAFLVPRNHALAIVGFAWAVNQLLGFTVHHYPHTGATFAWGIAIGAASFASLLVAWAIARRGHGLATAASTFVASFVAFEVALMLASISLGGWGAYAAPIVEQLFLSNLMWFVGTLVVGLAVERMQNTSRA